MNAAHHAIFLSDTQAGHLLAVSVDTLVLDVHFPASTAPRDVAWKSLAVNLSDLAAMGAEPLSAQALCESPLAKDDWGEAVAIALREATLTPCPLDLAVQRVAGPARRVTVQVVGQVPRGLALTRDGARVGDRVWVSGTTGDAGAGLALIQGRLDAGADADADADAASLRERLDRPRPRLALGMALRGVASAAIDVSDGIAGDAGHIARRSGVGLRIHEQRLSVSGALVRTAGLQEARRLAAFAGDDYELLFTAPPQRGEAVQRAASAASTPVSCIGEVVAGESAWILDAAGRQVSGDGFQHFSTTAPAR